MARESTSKMKNGRAAGQSGLVSHMIKSAGDAGINMIKVEAISNTLVQDYCQLLKGKGIQPRQE